MTCASDYTHMIISDLKDSLDWMSKSTEELMEGVVFGKRKARAEFERRVPDGCLVPWKEKRGCRMKLQY